MKIQLTALMLFALLFLASCGTSISEKDKMANYIPDNAGMVMRLNPQSFMDKADFEAVKKMPFFQDMLKEAKAESKELAGIFENPANSGIDLTKSSFISLFFDGKKEPRIGVYLPLDDRSRFEQVLSASTADFAQSEYEGGTFYSKGSGGFVVYDDRAILIYGEQKNYEGLIADTGGSIAQNKNFAKFTKGKGDMSFWMHSAPFMEMMGASQAVQALKMFKEDDLKNNFSHGYVNFEKGAIEMEVKSYLSSGLKSDLSLIFGDGISHDFSRDFPGQHLQGIYTFSISPRGIYQLSKEYMLSGMVEQEAEDKLGVTMSELTKAFSGDIAAAFYLPDNIGDGTDMLRKNGGMIYAFEIGKKKIFHKMINNLVETGLLTQDGDTYSIGGTMGKGIKFYRKSDIFYAVFSKDNALFDQLVSGDFGTPSDIQKKIKKISKKHLASFVFQPGFLREMSDLDVPKLIEQLVGMEGAYGMDDGFLKTTFKDESVNSLKLFMEAINNAYLMDQKKKDSPTINEAPPENTTETMEM